jgi:aspartate-semialdehyde dehydrogenase
MNDQKKSTLDRSASASRSGLQKIAIVGAASLKGKEVKEVLDERNFPAQEIVLLDDDALGQLENVADEVTFIQNVTRSSFEKVDIVFFTGGAAFTRKHWPAAKAAGCSIVDSSYALESDATIAIRSPWMDRELEDQIAATTKVDIETTAIIAAHPAAVMLALLLNRAQKTGVLRSATVTYFEPVSEQGKQAMDELHRQSLNLLSFQDMPKEIFDVQVAFNVLPRFGEEAKVSLEDSAARIAKHFKAITRSRVEIPAMQVLHVPAFHGQTAAIYLDLERKIAPTDFVLALQGEHVQIVTQQDDAPSNVTASGQDNILVSIRSDPARDKGLWLWAAADNLKLSAITAIDCAASLAATRPTGKIQ